MANDLLSHLTETAHTLPTIRRLSDDETRAQLHQIVEKYRIDPDRIWWWQGLAVPHRVMKYNDSEEAFEILGKHIYSDEIVMMFVCDDQPPPWSCFEGSFSDIVKLIEEQWYFEYLLTPHGLEWLAFDNHHNEIVLAGKWRS